MEEVLYGYVWGMIRLQLTTDDVVKIRTTSCRWNVGDRDGRAPRGYLLVDVENGTVREEIGTMYHGRYP